MTTNQLLYVKFFIRKSKKNEKEGMLYIRISYNTKRVDFSFNHKITMKAWDSTKEKVKAAEKDYLKINREIDSTRARIYELYDKLRFDKKIVTPEILKNNLLGNVNEGQTLRTLIDYHRKTQSGILSEGTLKIYKTTESYLFDFLRKSRKMDDIFLYQIDYQFITEFEAHLRTYPSIHKDTTVCHNVVMKHLVRLKKLLNMALKLEWIQKNPFLRFKVNYTKVDRGHLSKEELQTLMNAELKTDRQKYIRDLFIFSCYTGLAYIDVRHLKPDNIVLGIDGAVWIHTKRHKTNIAIHIPLLPIALEILNKYKETPESLYNDLIFPPVTNHTVNNRLKDIAKICNLNKNLTYHLARHTFATTIALSNGVPIETVSKILGHTKLSTTQIYAKVMQDKISQDMSDLNKKLQNATNDAKKSQNIIYK